MREGVTLVEALLDDAATGPAAIPRHEQDLTLRSYFGREVPHDGIVRWTWPARRVVDFVRACDYHPLPSPWGYPTATVDGAAITLARVEPTGEPADEPPGSVVHAPDGVMVACGDEWITVTHTWHDGRRSRVAVT
jgi:methionyl-tRNA formyltransferase